MTTADLDTVLAIESKAQPNPWARTAFEECLASACQCMVATSNEGDIPGYGIMMMSSHLAELLNMTVAPDSRRVGVGRRLLDGLLTLVAIAAWRKYSWRSGPGMLRPSSYILILVSAMLLNGLIIMDRCQGRGSLPGS